MPQKMSIPKAYCLSEQEEKKFSKRRNQSDQESELKKPRKKRNVYTTGKGKSSWSRQFFGQNLDSDFKWSIFETQLFDRF